MESYSKFVKQSTKTKTRVTNWTEEEKIRLVAEVNLRRDVIEGDFGPHLTQKQKDACWNNVARLVSQVQGNIREAEKCKKKFVTLKSETKSKLLRDKKEREATGGGPPPPPLILTPEEELLAQMIGREPIDGIPGGMETPTFAPGKSVDAELDAITSLTAMASGVVSTMPAGAHSSRNLPIPMPQTVTVTRPPSTKNLEAEESFCNYGSGPGVQLESLGAAPPSRKRRRSEMTEYERTMIQITKERLEVEKERLAVEKERMQMEKERLAIERERGNTTREHFDGHFF